MKRQLMYSHETMIQTDNSEDFFCSCKCLLRAQSAESPHPPALSSLRNVSAPVTAVLNSPATGGPDEAKWSRPNPDIPVC